MKQHIGILIALLLVLVGIVAATANFGSRSITLVAKSWNNGKVHLWHDVGGDANASFIDIANGESCTRLDNETYQIGDGGPPIYYYKLACNGFTGYVETDQVR